MNSLEYQKQLYALTSKISRIKDPVVYRDLSTLANTPKNLITEISKEEVEVRRLRKETVKYLELKTEFEKSLSNLENFITFALLRSKK